MSGLSPAGGEPRVSLVVPVYLNEADVGPLVDEVESLQARLGGGLEAVFVVDGSPDGSYAALARALPTAGFPSVLVALSRNFGSFAAIRHGLGLARGRLVAVKAADQQEPVELVERMVAELEAGGADVAVGRREGRDDPAGDRFASDLFWRAYRALVQPEIPDGGVDVFACTRPVRDVLLAMGESHSSLVGQLFWAGFRRVEVPYRRLPRARGKSAWTFSRKLKYLLDSVFGFTDLPIRLLLAVGLTGTLAALAVGGIVGVAWALGWIEVRGYTPLMLGLALSSAAQMLGLGILGSYLWRTFENTKGRPLAVERLRTDFPGEPPR